MKILLTTITFILLGSTAICGLWLHAHPEKVVKSSVDFHVNIALATTVAVVVTIIYLLRKP